VTEGNAGRAWTYEDVEAAYREIGPEVGVPMDRDATEHDFGRLVHRTALAVLAPRSIGELEGVLAFANTRGLRLTARGRGMSQGGQSIPAGGVSLDLSRLTEIGVPQATSRTMRCSSGTTWRSAIASAAPHGFLPKVVPLNLDLTVGGLLSVAGVGATSHRFGCAVSCVAELEVVTGDGRRITCSETREPAVYQAVLGGLGRGGIIASADVELRPFKPRVRTFYLLFDDIGAWLEAQRFLVKSNRADYLEAFCTPCVQGLRAGPSGRVPFAEWFYALHVSLEYDPGHAPEQPEALAGLGLFRLVYVEDNDTVAFAARYDARFAAMKRSGAWLQPHPWVEAMIPGDRLQELLPAILKNYPLAFGDGPRLLFIDRHRVPPFLRMPEGPSVACCALLPVGVPEHILPAALDALVGIHRTIVAAGGKRVLSGWITMMDETALLDHFGEQAQAWTSARRALDPKGVLDSPLTYTDTNQGR
jgi:cytokinin dehydrogenase